AYGSAIYAEGEPLLVVERNTFASNNAGSRGTLMLYNAGGLLLSRNVFTDNNGYDESVLAYFTGKPVTMVNNLVVNNRGTRYVHGLSVSSADGLFINNTFANFSAPSQTVPVLF